MSRISLYEPAPDFELSDTEGGHVRLSDFFGKAVVLLVFNRGFV